MRGQTRWIARDGWSVVRSFRASFLVSLRRLPFEFALLDRFLQFPHILDRQLPVLGKLRHHRLRASSKETQNFVEQSEPRHIARDDRLENIGIADLADAAHRLLAFKPVYRRLNRRVCGLGLWKRLLN